ncbi:protein FAM47E-like [Guaruba guarouba]
MSLGGGNWNIDEDALMRLLNTSCEREATDPSLFNAVKFINMETKQLKSQGMSPPQLAVRSSHYLRSLPCQVMVPSQTKWEKIRYGAWYLDPKTWRKQKANEHQKNQRPQSIALGVRRTGLKSYCESQKLHHSSMK